MQKLQRTTLVVVACITMGILAITQIGRMNRSRADKERDLASDAALQICLDHTPQGMVTLRPSTGIFSEPIVLNLERVHGQSCATIAISELGRLRMNPVTLYVRMDAEMTATIKNLRRPDEIVTITQRSPFIIRTPHDGPVITIGP